MADNTQRLVEECCLTHLHVFPYSPRDMTPAARMPQVAPAQRAERAKRLRAAGERALARHLDSQIGKEIEILAERGGVGRARDYTLVGTPGVEPGKMFEGTVVGHDGRKLILDSEASGSRRA